MAGKYGESVTDNSDPLDNMVEKSIQTALLSALQLEDHKINKGYERDHHQFFTPKEIDATHRHNVRSTINHYSLMDELCLLSTLHHLHLLGE